MSDLKEKLQDLHTRLIDYKDGYERAMERVESSMMGDSDEQVLAKIVRGEQELLDAYNDAIGPATGQYASFEFLKTQYSSLQSHIDSMKTRKQVD